MATAAARGAIVCRVLEVVSAKLRLHCVHGQRSIRRDGPMAVALFRVRSGVRRAWFDVVWAATAKKGLQTGRVGSTRSPCSVVCRALS
jgi:hypothetical protein